MGSYPQTFTKAERIKSKLIINRLFEGGSASFVAFPFRIVYMTIPKGDAPTSILISVPKRRFHHAVDRNHIKRQVREAYRKQKYILWKALENSDKSIAIAFISIASQHYKSNVIEKCVKKAICRIEHDIQSNKDENK